MILEGRLNCKFWIRKYTTPSNNIDHKIDQIRFLVLVEVDVGGPKSDAQIYHIQNFHLQDDGLQNDESKFWKIWDVILKI